MPGCIPPHAIACKQCRSEFLLDLQTGRPECGLDLDCELFAFVARTLSLKPWTDKQIRAAYKAAGAQLPYALTNPFRQAAPPATLKPAKSKTGKQPGHIRGGVK